MNQGRSSFYLQIALFLGAAILLLGHEDLLALDISGKVVEGDQPVAGAVVRVQATAIVDTTDNDGQFILTGVTGTNFLMVTASKAGFYINGSLAVPGDQPMTISLDKYIRWDDKKYSWLSPEPPSTTEVRCINCHSGSVIPQWKGELHSRSAVDPIVLTMYNGTDVNRNRNIEPGFKLDFPDPRATGDCASCHAPTAALAVSEDSALRFNSQPEEVEGCGNCHAFPWKVDLNNVSGVDRNGVFCDFCHKIVDTEANTDGSKPGIMSIKLMRPAPDRQLFFGTFDDVPVGLDTYSRLYKSSLYCAPCHQHYNHGIPIYSEYPEWAASPYAQQGIECQGCHMKPDGVTTNVAPTGGGVERDPMTIPSHLQMGGNDSIFIAETVIFEAKPLIRSDTLLVKVSITNEKGGHHFPTGTPMRNMILVVDARDDQNRPLFYLGDERVPEWGGIGTGVNDYGGSPGKGFAKILQDQPGNYPAPQWRSVSIRSDTRIPAQKTDVSYYAFRMPFGAEDAVITTQLIYRKAFKPWADAKGWNLKDYIVAKDSIALTQRPASLTGDFNRDGIVDLQDFFVFAQRFGSKQNEEKYDTRFDLDSDGKIGFSDFFLFAQNFGKKM